MKRLIYCLAATILFFGNAAAQKVTSTYEAGENVDGLAAFTSVEVDGNMRVRLVKLEPNVIPYVKYDTKGDSQTRFAAKVGKDGVLKISERTDPRRSAVTEVELYYNDINSISAARATVTSADTIRVNTFDIAVADGGLVDFDIVCDDMKASVNNKGTLTLRGTTTYLDLSCSAAKANLGGLQTRSAEVFTSLSGEADIWTTERLIAESVSSGKIKYKGLPKIVRKKTSSVFGGDIIALGHQ